ncbi:hypothetical protein MC885_016358 [Smutsia gigantea]|nr:hypothetical protein MC885_016358 [Smutsia gigantea]
MASCREWDPKVLVAIVCGLLTITVLGLGIWRTVIRIQRGTFTTESIVPIEFCRNGGTWQNGRCTCPEEWKGLRCTITNFCENSTFGDFTFARIPVGRYGTSLQMCDKSTPNVLENVTIGNCNENLETLEKQIVNISKESDNISAEAQILTSDANKLTPNNLTSATRVAGQIFNASRNASTEAKRVAVTTVSQLLDASDDVFQRAAAADNDNTFATLVEQMENYSLSLGNESVVSPNLAVKSVNFSSKDTVGSTDILFTVTEGSSDSFVSGSIYAETNKKMLEPNQQTELQILLSSQGNSQACGFVVYKNNKLFQSKTFKAKSNFTQKIISSSTKKIERAPSTVKMIFSPKYNQQEFQLHSYACVYWNFSMKDWDTYGCQKVSSTDKFLNCSCNHTTNFAVLMSFRKTYKYPESLDIISNVGCALSITGLALTIVFQIVTRKGRKTSITWVLVSLCMSMLVFNLFFVFGIENSNKNLKTSDTSINDNKNEMPTQDIIVYSNPTCTVIAALMHYFLLATFTWSGLNAAQLYFLLIRTMKPLPQHFTLFISLIGWGVPAVVVALTVGIIYSLNGNDPEWEFEYRQEEICWLAISKSNGFITVPFLWSFLTPVTIILISNVVIFIIIMVKVLWKNNQNLTSTKKVSSLKKILSTLSIAVVSGITWVLAYLMLIGNENIRIIFSYIFCLFNTTQGLQIFILYTVRTKIFQSEASKVLNLLSSSTSRVKSLPSVISMRLSERMYNLLWSSPALNENFRLLDPSVITEETTLSESDQANTSI